MLPPLGQLLDDREVIASGRNNQVRFWIRIVLLLGLANAFGCRSCPAEHARGACTDRFVRNGAPLCRVDSCHPNHAGCCPDACICQSNGMLPSTEAMLAKQRQHRQATVVTELPVEFESGWESPTEAELLLVPGNEINTTGSLSAVAESVVEDNTKTDAKRPKPAADHEENRRNRGLKKWKTDMHQSNGTQGDRSQELDRLLDLDLSQATQRQVVVKSSVQPAAYVALSSSMPRGPVVSGEVPNQSEAEYDLCDPSVNSDCMRIWRALCNGDFSVKGTSRDE